MKPKKESEKKQSQKRRKRMFVHLARIKRVVTSTVESLEPIDCTLDEKVLPELCLSQKKSDKNVGGDEELVN